MMAGEEGELKVRRNFHVALKPFSSHVSIVFCEESMILIQKRIEYRAGKQQVLGFNMSHAHYSPKIKNKAVTAA